MSHNIQVDESFVASLIRDAAWREGEITLNEVSKEDTEKVEEQVHTCPLCESLLDEELTDEVIFEHVNQIQIALQSLEEGSSKDMTPEEETEVDEGSKKGAKSKDKPGDKGDFETGARKGDKSDDDPEDEGDFETDQRKGDDSKTHKGKDFAGVLKKAKGLKAKAKG